MSRGGGVSGLVLLAVMGCTDQGLTESVLPPGGDRFEPVSEMLGVRCGSLDCHGDGDRNLRIHHRDGLRLGSEDIVGGDDTTPEEHAENYVAVVLLEPELLEDVVRAAGAAPERLTLVRKARGSERHEGGNSLTPAADRCLLSWLEGSVDDSACTDGAARPRPDLP